MRPVVVAVLAVAAVASSCAQHSPSLLTPAPPKAAPVSTLAPPIPATENIRPTELQRGGNSSLSLVQVRDREPPHVHTRYDITVTIADGTGTLWLNGVPLPMRSGDTAFIPRGTPHYFVNEGDAPAQALVVFSPAFTGPDQQPAP